ncbi:hypothetical protein NM688_g5620 [Phlebia brevispora]|uniref:Uncharacterized protein n=1 Tax=Phlebia brevispora TaxID=194682 RepID=A0ACC1SSN4_9APHY|nr:hypothetical protein NM688_g5620 [Phlebia brevispora]
MSGLVFAPRSANGSDPYSDPAYIEAVVFAFRTNLLENYSLTAAACLACYEFIIGFKHEYSMLWRGMNRWTSASWLLAANRYLVVAYAIIAVTPTGPQLTVPCWDILVSAFVDAAVITCAEQLCYNAALRTFLYILELMPSVVSMLFDILRVYALMHGTYWRWIAAALVFLLCMVPIVSNAVSEQKTCSGSSYWLTSIWCRYDYCHNFSPSSTHRSIKSQQHPTTTSMILSSVPHVTQAHPLPNLPTSIALTNVVASLTVDLVMLAITWLKAHRQLRHVTSVVRPVNLHDRLLQYGCLYLLLDLSWIALSWPQGGCLKPIIISRFLSSLYRTVRSVPALSVTETTFESLSIPTFEQRVVGPMGHILSSGPDDEEEEPY